VKLYTAKRFAQKSLMICGSISQMSAPTIAAELGRVASMSVSVSQVFMVQIARSLSARDRTARLILLAAKPSVSTAVVGENALMELVQTAHIHRAV
jgi:hypothetical protein